MIKQKLEEKQIEPNKWYDATDLWEIMTEMGLTRMKRESFTTDFINRKIKRGELVLREKHERGPHRFTGTQLEKIIRAFVPGGSGYYNYEEDEDVAKSTAPQRQLPQQEDAHTLENSHQ